MRLSVGSRILKIEFYDGVFSPHMIVANIYDIRRVELQQRARARVSINVAANTSYDLRVRVYVRAFVQFSICHRFRN